jgi:hypothetical protein
MNIKNTYSKLRGNSLSLLVTIIAIAIILIPLGLIHAASSNYSFTMDYLIVDGKENGQYHTLDSGTGYISGSAYAYNSSINVHYELMRNVFGPDPSYGSVNGGINQSFNETFPNTLLSDDNYYLIVWRTGFDGITVNGSGTLHN